jgi:hypothetical protein
MQHPNPIRVVAIDARGAARSHPLTERLKPLCCGIMIPLKGIATAVGWSGKTKLKQLISLARPVYVYALLRRTR